MSSAPSQPPPAPGSRGFVAGESTELPEKRTETSREFANPDGTHTTQLSPGPMNFMKDGAWTPIDSRVVADPAGGYRSAANAWTARFGTLSGGVAVESDRGTVRWVPRGAAAADPVVADTPEGGSVLYADAWPGVDLRYTVRPDGVKEEILLKRRGTASSFVFGTGGARPTAGAAPGTLKFAGLAPGGKDWVVPAAEALGPDGRPLAAAGASATVEDGPATGPAVRVSVAPQWLAAQPDAAFPISLDPSLSTGGGSTCYKSDGTTVGPCQVRIGNPNDGYGTWRTVSSFNIAPVLGAGRFVYGAWVTLDDLSAGTANSYGGALNSATGYCYSCYGGQLQGAVIPAGVAFGDSGGSVTGYYDSLVQAGNSDGKVLFAGAENAGVYSYKQFAYFLLELDWDTKPSVASPVSPSPANGASIHTLTPSFSATATDADGDALQYDYVVSLAPNDVNAVWESGWVSGGARTIPADRLWWGNTYYWHVYVWDGHWRTDPNWTRTFTVSNAPPTAPTLSSPGAGAVLTAPQPTLAADATTDPDGDTGLQYQFRITASDDINTGLVIDSAWQTGLTWQVPALSLRDGTYTWAVRARDALGLPTSTSAWSQTRKFRYDMRLGIRPTLPYDTVGPLAVNLATGNVTTAISGPSLGTLGGPVGVTLSYDSQRPTATGLEADYIQDWDADGAVDANEAPLVHRVDQQVSFQWGTTGPALGQVRGENFIGVWSGRLLPPNGTAGTYRVVVDSTTTGTPSGAATGRATVWAGGTLDANKKLDNAAADFAHPSGSFSIPAGGTAFKLLFAHGTGPSNLVLRVYADGGNPAAAAMASASMLRPDVAVLPDGWASTGLSPMSARWTRLQPLDSAQVALFDGNGATHVYTSSGTGWLPPADDQAVLTREEDGSWSLLSEDGYLYRFDTAGRLVGIDSGSDDLHPGALSYGWGSPNSNGVQRLTSVTDAAGRAIQLKYGNGTANPDCSTVSGGTTYDAAPVDQLCRVDYAGFGVGTMELLYSAGHLARVVNPGMGANGTGSLGPTWDLTYTAGGLLETVREPLTNDLMFTPVGGSPAIPASEQASLRHRTVIAYSGNRAASVTRPVDRAAALDADRLKHDYTWTAVPGDPNGTLASSEVDVRNLPMPNGYARHVDLDPSGMALHELGPDGTGVDNTWDTLKERLTETVNHHHQAGSAGFKTTYTYDSADRLIAAIGPASPTEIAAGTAPVARTAYDEGIAGLAAAWYANPGLSGAPALHSTSAGTENWGPGGPSRSGYYFPSNSYSGRLTGDATLAGASKLRVAADGARLYVDDKLQVDTWGGPYRSAVRKDVPLHHWRLGEAAGAPTAADAAGFAPGVYAGGVTRGIAGALRLDTDGDAAAALDGAVGSGATATDAAMPRAGVTLEAWVYLPDASRRGAFISVGSGAGGYGLGVGASSFDNGSPGNNLVGLFDGVRWINSGQAIGTGWHHVAMSIGAIDGSGNNTATFFIDGQQKAALSGPAPNPPGSAIAIGGYTTGSNPRWFNGSLDELAVYPSVLSQAQVAAHYTAGATSTSSTADSTDTIAAGTHRIRLEYQELTGNAALALSAPSTTMSLSPRYSLPTSSTDADGNVNKTAYSDATHGPEFGLATAVTAFPAKAANGGSDTSGKQLTTTASYETPTTSGAYLRQTGKTLPNGAGTAVSYSYYGIAETADNPCPGGATGIKQAGAMKEERDADPDGAGPQRRIVRQARYDLVGRLIASRSSTEDKIATAAWACTTYDARGRATQSTDRTGKSSSSAYTTADRLTTNYTDSAGAARSTVSTVDWLGRPLTYTDEQGTVTRSEYDLAGRLVKKYRTLPAQPEALLWETAYDTAGRTSMVKDYSQNPAATTTFAWDPTGLVKTVTRPNGVSTTVTTDASRGRAASVAHAKGAQQSTWGYSYTLAGRVAQESGTGSLANRTRAFSYDAAGRLAQTAETGASPATRNYAYDDDSNRCARAATCAVPEYTYDSADRITSSPDYSSYTYDDYGNVVSAAPRTQPPAQQFGPQSVAFDTASSGAPTDYPITAGQAGAVSASLASSGTATAVNRTGSASGAAAAGQTGSAAMTVDGQSRLSASVTWPKDSRRTTSTTSPFLVASLGGSDPDPVDQPVTTSAAGDLTADLTWQSGYDGWSRDQSDDGSIPALGHLDIPRTFKVTANGGESVYLSSPNGGTSAITTEVRDENGTLVASSLPTFSGVSFTVSDLAYGQSHTYSIRLVNHSPVAVTEWWMSTSYTGYANVTLEVLNSAGARVALGSQSTTQPSASVTYPNAPAGSYTIRMTSADFNGGASLTETHSVGGFASVALLLKNPAGAVVAQTPASATGSLSLAYTGPPTAPSGAYTWSVVNSDSLFSAAWSLSWTATTLADDISTGSISAGASAPRAVTADASGYANAALTWTKGNHPVQSSSPLTVPAGSTGSKTITPDASGAVSATYAWNPDTKSYSGSGSVGTAGTSFGPEFSAGANGTVTITLGWGAQTPNPDLDLEVIDKATGSTVQSSAQLTGNQEQVQFSQSGLSYGGSKTYQVKVTAKTVGSSYTLSGSYPVWDKLSKLELLSGSTVVASATPPTSGTASVTLTTSGAVAAGTYAIRATSGGYRSTGTLTETHQVQAFADLTLQVKNASGGVVGPGDRQSTGTAGYATTLPSSGSYSVLVTNNSADIAVPSYSLTVTRPKSHAPTARVDLLSGSTVLATGTSANPSTLSASVPGAGSYTLRVTPVTGAGTATLTGSYPSRPALATISYDGRDHATSIDDGTARVVETLSPSGRVLQRKVIDDVSGAVQEDTLYGYDDGGDSPAYARPASGGTVTTFVDGPGGVLAVVTGTAPSWPLYNGHGDVVATADAAGTMTAAPSTDEFGVGQPASGTLGWLGAQQRETVGRLGVLRMGVRLYDPSLGRFLQVDPVAGGSCNDYDYVCADPVNMFDLTGLYIDGYARWDVNPNGNQHAGSWTPDPNKPVMTAAPKAPKPQEKKKGLISRFHVVGALKFAALVVAVAAIPATGGASIALGLAAGGLSITAEAVDSKPCRGERVGLAVGLTAAGAGLGSLFGGASQAAGAGGQVAMQRAADLAGSGASAGAVLSNAVSAKC